MLTPDKIISDLGLIDEILIGIKHPEDTRRSVSDSEIIITALVAAEFFGGNQYHAIHFMKSHGYIPKIISESWLNRDYTKKQIQEKLEMRKRVETTISKIKKLFLKTIHAVSLNGFLIKLILFVFALQIIKFLNWQIELYTLFLIPIEYFIESLHCNC